MSIPKEPRQLMINLMYLVLTAMLALNVSAEIINAFFMLDKGIKHTNEIVDSSVAATINAMKETVKEKKDLEPIANAAATAPEKIKPLIDKIAELRAAITNEGGLYIYDGDYHGASASSRKEKYEKEGFTNIHMTKDISMEGKPVDKKNKDITQRILVDNGEGTKLKELINSTRAELLSIIDGIVKLSEEKDAEGKPKMKGVKFDAKQVEELKAELVLEEQNDETAKEYGKPDWASHVFAYMPVASCYPLLRKFENDAKNATAQIVNFLSSNMGNKVLVYDKFSAFSSSEKPYILLGETYEAEIALGAFSSQAEFTVSVNGSPLKVEDGKAKYTARPGSVGTQSYRASITVVNPLTGETEKVDKEFKYEVGAPSVTVAADQMNVFYMGVDNPISVAAAGVSSNDIDVRISGGGGGALNRVANGKYNVKVTKQTGAGEFCNIDVYDKKNNKKLGTYPFRVKRIPDPVAKLTNNQTDGVIPSGEMKVQRGLMAILENFDFNAKCEIQGFVMYFTPPRQDPVEITNGGGVFTGQAAQAVQNAKPGTLYQFMDVKGRCPGDSAGRKLNGLAFKVR